MVDAGTSSGRASSPASRGQEGEPPAIGRGPYRKAPAGGRPSSGGGICGASPRAAGSAPALGRRRRRLRPAGRTSAPFIRQEVRQQRERHEAEGADRGHEGPRNERHADEVRIKAEVFGGATAHAEDDARRAAAVHAR